MSKTRPLRLYLIRHGESVANVDWREFARTNDQHIALTERGREQARLTGEFLKSYLPGTGASAKETRLWNSPYRRTRDTAAAIKQMAGLCIGDSREDIALVEQQMGLFDGIGMDQWAETFPREHRSFGRHEEGNGNFFGRAPQGESAFDVSLRVRILFPEFHRHYREDGISTVVIVAHGGLLRVLAMQWLHKSPEWYLEQEYSPNAAVRLIEGQTDHGYIFVPEVAGAPGESPVATHEKPHIDAFMDQPESETAA